MALRREVLGERTYLALLGDGVSRRVLSTGVITITIKSYYVLGLYTPLA